MAIRRATWLTLQAAQLAGVDRAGPHHQEQREPRWQSSGSKVNHTSHGPYPKAKAAAVHWQADYGVCRYIYDYRGWKVCPVDAEASKHPQSIAIGVLVMAQLHALHAPPEPFRSRRCLHAELQSRVTAHRVAAGPSYIGPYKLGEEAQMWKLGLTSGAVSSALERDTQRGRVPQTRQRRTGHSLAHQAISPVQMTVGGEAKDGNPTWTTRLFSGYQ